jgi:hypothetical protein
MKLEHGGPGNQNCCLKETTGSGIQNNPAVKKLSSSIIIEEQTIIKILWNKSSQIKLEAFLIKQQ